MSLTPEQQLASDPNHNVWVTANAGTGKTKVLTDRYIRLLLRGQPAESILCVTFTNAAAGEMKERVLKTLSRWSSLPADELLAQLNRDYQLSASSLPNIPRLYLDLLHDLRKLHILTIHSFCHQLLTQFTAEANLRPGFQLMSDLRKDALLEETAELLCQRAQKQPDGPLNQALTRLSQKYNITYLCSEILPGLIRYHALSGYDSTKHFSGETHHHSEALYLIAQGYNAIYKTLKQQYNLIDFDDLIYEANALLADSTAAGWVRYKLDSRIDHILVDEAQDTNPQQWAIINALTDDFFSGHSAKEGHRSLFVVGDEKQSIYGFQGSRPDHFLAQKQNADAVPLANLQTISLQHSFRSAQPIMDIVNSLCAQIRYSHHHETARKDLEGTVALLPLIPENPKPKKPQHPVPWAIYTDYADTTDPHTQLAHRIASLIDYWLRNGKYSTARKAPLQPQDIMVLFKKRVTGELMKKTASALRQHAIPTVGADRIKLSDHILFADIKRLLMFFHNTGDCLSLACVLKSPLIAIDDEVLEALCANRESTLHEAIAKQTHPAIIAAYKGVSELLTIYRTTPLRKLIYHIFEVHNHKAVYNKRFGTEANDLLLLLYENLDALDDLQTLTDYIHLFESDIELKKDPNASHNAVRLSTIHNAKGLQAPIVILADATDADKGSNDAVYWHEDSPLLLAESDKKTAEIIASKENNKQMATQEAHRLLYVALTRAEEAFYVGGIEPKKEERYWYGMIEKALNTHNAEFHNLPPLDSPVLMHTNAQARYDRMRNPQSTSRQTAIPAHLVEPISPNAANNMDKTPAENAIRQAHAPDRNAALGAFIHKVLELYGKNRDLDVERSIETLYPHFITDKNAISMQQITTWIHNILQYPAYREFITQHGQHRFEISITEQTKAGQNRIFRIDHMIETHGTIVIIDYKSGKPPTTTQLPDSIRYQMHTYRTLMSEKHPDKHIACHILWLQTGTVSEVH